MTHTVSILDISSSLPHDLKFVKVESQDEFITIPNFKDWNMLLLTLIFKISLLS